MGYWAPYRECQTGVDVSIGPLLTGARFNKALCGRTRSESAASGAFNEQDAENEHNMRCRRAWRERVTSVKGTVTGSYASILARRCRWIQHTAP